MRLFAAVLAALFALVFGTASGFAERRVALVVGNDRYPNLTDREQLQKAVSDARAVGAAFRQLGFEVIAGENLTRQQFVNRLDQLVYRLSPGDVAAFFFSGHGVALEGMNYILPSDVPDLQSGQEIRLKGAAYAEQDIIDELRRRGVRVAVVVLDACRTNPLGRVGAKSLGGEKGLAAPREVAGVFSLYAASPGQAALDRLSDGDPDPNSVFTRVLVPALTRRGVDLIEMAKQVQEEVARLARTVQHDQLPAYLDRVQGREYLAGRPAQVGALNEDQRPPPAVFIPSAPANDERAWNLVSDSKNPDLLRRFIDQFPTSARRGDAVRRLEELAKQETARRTAAQEDWKSVEHSTNIVALEAFRRRYPDTLQAELAGQQIDELQSAKTNSGQPQPVSVHPPISRQPDTEVHIAAAPTVISPSGRRGSYWDFNGSLVHLDADPNSPVRRFSFDIPNATMEATGARRGSVLFTGRRSGNTYSGVARTFAGRCGSFSYSVTGHVFDDDEGISMSGRKPEIDESSCRVRGYSAMHMELRYKYRIN